MKRIPIENQLRRHIDLPNMALYTIMSAECDSFPMHDVRNLHNTIEPQMEQLQDCINNER